MLETRGNRKSSSALVFEPRQVMLAKQQQKMMNKQNCSETPENDITDRTKTQKSVQKEKRKKKKKYSSECSSGILHLIANFLEHKGLSKTLAAFKSEAANEELDGLKRHAMDLEEIYSEYLEHCKHDGEESIPVKREIADLRTEEHAENDKGETKFDAQVKSVSKIKRKESKGSAAGSVNDQHGLGNGHGASEMLLNGAEPDLQVEPKKKKKKVVSDGTGKIKEFGLEVVQEPADNMACEDQVNKPVKKPKVKKKKGDEPTPESLTESVNGRLDKSSAEDIYSTGILEEKKVKSKDKKRNKKLTTDSLSQATKEDTTKTESKTDNFSSLDGNAMRIKKKDKKRKRLNSEEKESQPDDKIASKESNQNNGKGSEEDKANDLQDSEGHAGKKKKTKHGQDESDKLLKASLTERLSATDKSMKKQQNGSAEPKTVNAFRRVEIEKVEFVDERLQDNSFWAKDGADTGYGAKAQEVLGQVTGSSRVLLTSDEFKPLEGEIERKVWRTKSSQLKNVIREDPSNSDIHWILWNAKIPLRVSFVIWAPRNNVPTVDIFKRRGIAYSEQMHQMQK